MPVFSKAKTERKQLDVLHKKTDPMEALLKRNIVGLMSGKEVTLGRYPNPPYRIGWVWKDTGLPPTNEEMEVALKEKNA
jgi:hypothetical protein